MILRTVCFIILIALLLALTACDVGNLGFSENPPASTQTPPLYPGATQVTTQNLIHYGGSAKQISFETSAKPEAIMEFYETNLVSDGWIISDLPNQHRFLWARVGRKASYELDLNVSKITEVQTRVEITLTEDLGR